METQFSFTKNSPTGLLIALLVFALSGFLHSQNPCPPVIGTPTTNPDFPGCLAPGSDAFKVLLVLDESGSIGNAPGGFEDEFEGAVNLFAQTLKANVTGAGQMQMGIVEFSSSASVVIPLKDVNDANFLSTISNYLNGENISVNPNYNPNNPSALTNFEAALNAAKSVAGVDMIFFITDGNPTTGGNMNTWMNIANQIKCAGTYIFGIGLGSSISPINIQALSGPDQLNNPSSLQEGADWTQESFTSLPGSLVDLANSQIDRDPPKITCPSSARVTNDPGACGKKYKYPPPTVTDNCPNVSSSCSPASGTFFPVGATAVTCTATDNVGQKSMCTFTVTVIDLEPPHVECPADKAISCEESPDPANTGNPIALDNCGIGSVTHTDVRTDGSCIHDFSIARTWTVIDIHGNNNVCVQTIAVSDTKPPILTCPKDITVDCDTTTAATGVATVKDNCDPTPKVVYKDKVVGGDCEWLCQIERTWTATDVCGNKSTCTQHIEKNLLPLIEEALLKDITGDGRPDPLVMGATNTTLTINSGDAHCILQWMPYNGTVPVGLEAGNQVVGPGCAPGTNGVDGSGRLTNPLLSEAIKLALYLRTHTEFGKKKVKDLPNCTMAPIVLQAMAKKENSDMNEFMRITNISLGNNGPLVMPSHLQALLDALLCVNRPLDLCDPKN